jgi:phthalate 4,5-dioxygenase
MLSAEENEFLTRVGPGTAMGALMRQYWLPALLSEELPERDGRPQRVRLLCENLIAFRDSNGDVGMLADNCPHRGASLFFGRNEEAGLRCVYHGWKFDVRGRCIDMPNEPPESNFKDKVHAISYPCRDWNGIIWTYMGPRTEPPPLPEYEFAMVPGTHRNVMPFVRECNYLQALEGDIDSAHSSFLHAVLNKSDINNLGTGLKHVDRHPRFEVLDTDFGVTIAARRTPEDPSKYYWRLTQFMFPFMTYFPPTGEQMETVPGHIWIPIDDDTTLVWGLRWHPDQRIDGEDPGGQRVGRRQAGGAFAPTQEYLPATTRPAGRWRWVGNSSNDYLLDYEAQQTRRFSGVPTIPLQDQAMTESMGTVMNRPTEHLGSTDAGIIRVRQALMRATQALADNGTVPPGVDAPEVFRIRSASGLLPKETNWIEGTRDWVQARQGVPVVSA